MPNGIKKLILNVVGYGSLAVVATLAGFGIAWVEEQIDEE